MQDYTLEDFNEALPHGDKLSTAIYTKLREVCESQKKIGWDQFVTVIIYTKRKYYFISTFQENVKTDGRLAHSLLQWSHVY